MTPDASTLTVASRGLANYAGNLRAAIVMLRPHLSEGKIFEMEAEAAACDLVAEWLAQSTADGSERA